MKASDEQIRDWLKELRLNGFVVLRRFLPVEWVRAVHDQLLPILRGELERANAGTGDTERGRHRLAFDVTRYAELLDGPLADDLYRRNPTIERLVSAVFGEGNWRRGWSQVECVWRGAVHMDWHSDQTLPETPDADAQNAPLRLTFNIPLVDFTWANGAMEMLPGSHHLPRNFLADHFRSVANLYPVPLRLDRGDAIFRDGNTLHRGTPNLTEHPRPMLDQTYKKDGDASDVEPHRS